MATGIYISEKRIERNGILIAHAGEEMTMDEAAARGLIEPDKKDEKKAKADKKDEK